MNNDLISRSALIEYFKDLERALAKARCFNAADAIQGAVKKIKTAPAVDAEPVIRCNVCKYYETDTGYCHMHDHGMDWDDFCSRGEKVYAEVEGWKD